MRTEITRRTFLGAAGLVATGSWLLSTVSAAEPNGLRAGAATADITPALGVSLSGPISKRGPAQRIVTPLDARALVLDNGRERIAFVVCDCTIIYRDIVDRAKRLVQERTGLPPERIVIASTHSHAAPRVGLATGELDLQYYDLFCQGIADAISTAIENLAPAEVGWGVGSKPEFVRCRRDLLEPGTLAMDPFGEQKDRAVMRGGNQVTRPAGPADPQVGVLSVQHADGRPMAVLASFPVHYVTGDKRGDVTADYWGHFADRLATLMKTDKAGPPFVGIMARSPGGDIAPYRGGYDGMKKLGHALAEEAFRVCQQIEYRDQVPLGVCQSTIDVDVRRPDTKRIEWANAVLAGTWKGKGLRNSKIYAQQALELAQFPATVPVCLQAFRVGDLGITTVPCELFASTGIAIRKDSPLQPYFNIDMANGFWCYLPPPEQHKLGGYTTWAATSSCFEVEAEPKILRELLRLLHEVARPADRE
ncbi:MAG: neutral/alkaline non-lysosomal ceramidase N-terminal domain-containing protein [Planctomycetes bacterium]|nr:neutral/alkaline non-lysosomal ceramidase N-terminal domain-containing protein [Planctomycetota bacterium]MBL7038781.1 neutral/alkaline non-lysosomal ceramidase N-terminal domain-containing protein [Pirellulaceae bacterium]